MTIDGDRVERSDPDPWAAPAPPTPPGDPSPGSAVTDRVRPGQTATRAGWYPDPLDRFESRYHNGAEWTADVASGGRRYVDPDGLEPADGPGSGRNRSALTSMVLGIVGVAIGWLPLLFAVGALASLLALIFGAIGLRRARRTGIGRSQAIVGLTTGGCGIAAAVIGATLTFLVVDALDTYENPNAHTTTITECSVSDGTATASGQIVNDGTTTADFVVRIDFIRTGTDNVQRRSSITVDDVEPGGSATFVASQRVSADDVDCRIRQVNGPLPFGLDLDG